MQKDAARQILRIGVGVSSWSWSRVRQVQVRRVRRMAWAQQEKAVQRRSISRLCGPLAHAKFGVMGSRVVLNRFLNHAVAQRQGGRVHGCTERYVSLPFCLLAFLFSSMEMRGGFVIQANRLPQKTWTPPVQLSYLLLRELPRSVNAREGGCILVPHVRHLCVWRSVCSGVCSGACSGACSALVCACPYLSWF